MPALTARLYALLGLLSVALVLAWIAMPWRGKSPQRFGLLMPALAVVAFAGCAGGSNATSNSAGFAHPGTTQILVTAASGTCVQKPIFTVQVR